jgi:cephalosporin-C deacetylase
MPSQTFPHHYAFDPAYGQNLAQLLAIEPPAPPSDFAAFWQTRYQAAIAQDAQPKLTATDQTLGSHRIHALRYRSTDGVDIGGWLLTPLHATPVCGILIGHGYGGREAPEGLAGLDDAVLLFPCLRGIGLSPLAGLSAHPYRHVLHDIQDRNRYVLGGCVEDLWLGVSALLQLFPHIAGRVAISGVSFCGGLGAMAAPWDARIGRLHIQAPSFGHQALRMTLPCIGSGEAVRAYQRHHRFNVMETLAYYDAASAALHLNIPTLVEAALFDPVVPPPGQFAIYNAIPKQCRHLLVLPAGHFDYPGKVAQEQRQQAEAARFLMGQESAS